MSLWMPLFGSSNPTQGRVLSEFFGSLSLARTANVVLPLSGLAGQPCPLLVVAGTVCMPLMLTSVQSSYVTVGVVAVVFAFIQVSSRCFSFRRFVVVCVDVWLWLSVHVGEFVSRHHFALGLLLNSSLNSPSVLASSGCVLFSSSDGDAMILFPPPPDHRLPHHAVPHSRHSHCARPATNGGPDHRRAVLRHARRHRSV